MTVILIVEDNPRNLKLVRDLLEHAGHTTLEAATAEDGLALARAHGPDLVLMDVQLPGMDGVQALARLRADPATQAIPVVALTAFAMEDERARFAAAGFDGYLEKPISVRAFPGQVAELLEPGGADMSDAPRILVVDDLAQNIRLLEAVLAPRGHEVVAAGTGAEALALAAAGDIDLVLLDIVMPEMDGYEVCRRLRDGPGHALPADRDDHRQRRPGEAHGDRGRRRRLRVEAVRPCGAARARPLAAAGEALPRHDRGAGRRAGRVQPAARGARARAGRRARAAGPAAPVPVAAARRARRVLGRRLVPREPPARDHRRLLRPPRLHRLRRDGRARGRAARARRVPPRARRSRPPLRGDARALHGRRADGVLQRPAAVSRRTRARGPDGGGDAEPRDPARGGVEPHGLRPAPRHRDRAGSRHPRADRLRGPLGLRGDRQRDEPRRAAVRAGGAGPDPRSARGCTPARSRWSRRSRSATCRCAGSPSRRGSTTSRGSTRPARAHERRRSQPSRA